MTMTMGGKHGGNCSCDALDRIAKIRDGRREVAMMRYGHAVRIV